ncbi:MAG: ComF family protein [Lachnospiraceae bacterium]|nr:ComF family protein [Lachnospiraceae bacterium]
MQPGQFFIELIYPRRCPICREIVLPKGSYICTRCRQKVTLVTQPSCMKCGKPLAIAGQEYCYDCVRHEHHYKRGFAVYVYDDVMRQSLGDFKFRGKKEYGDFFAQEIVSRYGKQIKQIGPDYLVPIPLHPAKRRKRGYNQAEILARKIGETLGIPVIPNLLKRNRNTIPQKTLDDKERLKNLRRAFSFGTGLKCSDEGLRNIKIMLVDDIYTTGSTIEACTNVLNKQGITDIYFVTVSIGRGY